MADRVSVVGDDALGSDDAVGLLERLRRREVSGQELAAAALSRIRRADERINAVVTWAPPRDADGADGPLAGLPTVIKDNEQLAGTPTREGSRATSDAPAADDSVWTAQFLRLGVTPLAKSTLPEFGLTSTTESMLTGPTRNPWDLDRSVGGSSGGSAALVAAGAVPLAHANDGGGSIRIPAACCGLVGLKPSRGRIIDIPDLDRLPVNIVAQGVVTRTVRDTALYFAAAEQDHTNPDLPPVGWVKDPPDRRLRVAVMTQGHPDLPTSPSVQAAVGRAAALCEELGHHVTEIDFPYGRQVGVDFLRYWAFLAFSVKRWGGRLFGEPFDAALLEPFTLDLARMFSRGPLGLPGALRRLKRFGAEYSRTFDEVDVVISPVLSQPPPPIGYLGPRVDPRTQLLRLLRFVSVTPLHNIAGAPAMSLPLEREADGLPIGIHIAADIGQERLLLQLALQLEQAAPWPVGVQG